MKEDLDICSARVQLCNRTSDNVKFTVMNGLLWDVILGREFLKLHESVQFNFGGPEQSLQLGVLEHLKFPNPVRLFEHMTPDCHPIAAKSRNYSKSDQEFIETRISQLLADDIIEPSVSPWRARL